MCEPLSGFPMALSLRPLRLSPHFLSRSSSNPTHRSLRKNTRLITDRTTRVCVALHWQYSTAAAPATPRGRDALFAPSVSFISCATYFIKISYYRRREYRPPPRIISFWKCSTFHNREGEGVGGYWVHGTVVERTNSRQCNGVPDTTITTGLKNIYWLWARTCPEKDLLSFSLQSAAFRACSAERQTDSLPPDKKTACSRFPLLFLSVL